MQKLLYLPSKEKSFHCGKTGHKASECPDKKNNGANGKKSGGNNKSLMAHAIFVVNEATKQRTAGIMQRTQTKGQGFIRNQVKEDS